LAESASLLAVAGARRGVGVVMPAVAQDERGPIMPGALRVAGALVPPDVGDDAAVDDDPVALDEGSGDFPGQSPDRAERRGE
jgi:hypothetical protein